jgi:hypothetical protein
MSLWLIFQICLLAGLVSVAECEGCRFNVRETGFVDLNDRPFVLVYYTDESTPRAFEEGFLKVAGELLAESTVTYELVETDLQPDHPALKYIDRSEEARFPLAQLVSPDEMTFPIQVAAEDATGEPDLDAVWQLVRTSARDRLTQQLATHYGVVLLVEGTDPEANYAALLEVEKAIAELESFLGLMPKPVRLGPVLHTLEASQFGEERVLLWALGLEAEQVSSPSAIVLYGKGRWLGPRLDGPEIKSDRLFQLLSIIGADCECGLDPGLLRGRALPIHWGPEIRSLVAAELGFDPENPLVRLEVGQIMRQRAWFYAERLPGREVAMSAVDDLPVPFVEDDSGSLFGDPLTRSVLWLVGGLSGLVVCFGFWLVVKGNRRNR